MNLIRHAKEISLVAVAPILSDFPKIRRGSASHCGGLLFGNWPHKKRYTTWLHMPDAYLPGPWLVRELSRLVKENLEKCSILSDFPKIRRGSLCRCGHTQICSHSPFYCLDRSNIMPRQDPARWRRHCRHSPASKSDPKISGGWVKMQRWAAGG